MTRGFTCNELHDRMLQQTLAYSTSFNFASYRFVAVPAVGYSQHTFWISQCTNFCKYILYNICKL